MPANEHLSEAQFTSTKHPSIKALGINRIGAPEDPRPSNHYKGNGNYTRMEIDPSVPIHTRQAKVSEHQVGKYTESGSMYSAENDSPAPALYLSGGQFYHDDGLHRIVAARRAGKSFPADVDTSGGW